jgi:MraZ protein
MFLGTYLVSITSGKRISIPSVFRENLGKDLVLAQWYEECLVLVSKGSLNTLLSRVTRGRGTITEPIRQTEHFILASSFEVEPDEQGRVVLPDRLMDYAKLKDQVYILGVGDRIEVWNKEIWDERAKQVALDAARYLEELAKSDEK